MVGKPAPFMLDYIANKFDIRKDQICMVGDRLDTDILFGKDGGLRTMLVLSGVTTEEMLKSPENDIHPDYYTKLGDLLTINQVEAWSVHREVEATIVTHRTVTYGTERAVHAEFHRATRSPTSAAPIATPIAASIAAPIAFPVPASIAIAPIVASIVSASIVSASIVSASIVPASIAASIARA